MNRDVRPLIEFDKFANPTSWLWECGPPEWLDDPRWPVRAMRASWVLGILGFASFCITTAYFFAVPMHAPIAVSLLFAPGFWFGLVVLMPLSRWLGRGWIMTFLAVPISILASWCGAIAFIGSCGTPFIIPEARNSQNSISFGGFGGGFVVALMVSVWMGHPRQRQSWRAGLYATAVATLGCGFGLLFFGVRGFDGYSVVMHGAGLFTLQCVVPVCLGMRLWSGSPCVEKC